MKKETISVKDLIEKYADNKPLAGTALKAFQSQVGSQIEGALREVEGYWQKKGIKFRLSIEALHIEFDGDYYVSPNQ